MPRRKSSRDRLSRRLGVLSDKGLGVRAHLFFKESLKGACEIGRRRADLADSTIKAHARKLKRKLDSLLELKPTNAEGRHLRDAIIVNARDKLLVFLTRRDVEPTNNGSERTLRPSGGCCDAEISVIQSVQLAGLEDHDGTSATRTGCVVL